MLDGGEIQLLTAASLAIFVVFLFLRWTKQKGANDAGKRPPPTLSLLRLVGSILNGGMAVLPEHFRRFADELGPVFSFKAGRSYVVVLNGYDAIVNAFGKQSETFADRVPLWIETEILNPELREFGYGQARVTETRIIQEVEALNREIQKHNGRPFDPKWPFVFATSDVALRILFGNNFEHSSPKEHSIIIKSVIECVTNMDLTLNVAPIVRFLPTYRRKVEILHRTSASILKAIGAGIEFTKSNDSEATFVGRFLKIEGSDYDHRDLVFVLRDLCFGGIETVATILLWALVELANNPEVLGRLQREIDEMVPGDRLPSLDDKPRMPYTEAVILELLRRRTIAPFLVPHSTLKDTKLFEYDLPKGCMVIGNVFSSNMDPKFWKDPLNFRPERFLDERDNIINSEKVLTFGIGKRSCLGEVLGRQSVFLFLTSLVQRFDIRPPEGQTSINVKEIVAITTAPTHFEVRLIPRVKTTQR